MDELKARPAASRAHGIVDPRARVEQLLREYPADQPVYTLLARCGENLAEVLRGDCEPLDLLFFEDDFAALEALYEESPFAQLYNKLVQAAVCAALTEFPRDRPVRILEIGAGTGGTTAAVLPAL